MQEIINIFVVSCVPASITGLLSYLSTNKKAKLQIQKLEESNKHEIEKLMKQHEVDIDALKEKHQLEVETSKQDHVQKMEIMKLEHQIALEGKSKDKSDTVMFSVMENVIKNPESLEGFMKLIENPIFKK
ncbi:MAG: hypothetical protein R3Y24_15505 [Eubacteriales bacterium]